MCLLRGTDFYVSGSSYCLRGYLRIISGKGSVSDPPFVLPSG